MQPSYRHLLLLISIIPFKQWEAHKTPVCVLGKLKYARVLHPMNWQLIINDLQFNKIVYIIIILFFLNGFFCIFLHILHARTCHAYTKDLTEIGSERVLFASLRVIPDRSHRMRRVACSRNCRTCALTIVLSSFPVFWRAFATKDEYDDNRSNRIDWRL